MKKNMVLMSLLVVVALFFSTASVFASSPEATMGQKTPGAQATLNATRPHGNAQNNNAAQNKIFENYRGVISAVDAANLSLTLKDDSVVAFVLTPDTKIKVPTLGNTATAAALLVNQNAVVRAQVDQAGVLTALAISVIPGKPVIIHRVGTVTAYVPGVSITISDKMGTLFTFLITADTKILPAERAADLIVGARVTIISPRNVTGGPLTAKGIVIHPANTGTGSSNSAPSVEATEIPAL